MDYRKPAVFGQNWSPSRYRVLPYFAVERAIFARADIQRIVEIGCGNGWNMSRFAQYGRPAIGLDAVPERVELAHTHGPALLSDGLALPFASGSVDLVYIQHVLHHIGDVAGALAEVRRVLRPGGVLFLVETVEDNLIIRYGRQLYPSWLGDEINAPFYYRGLGKTLQEADFEVSHSEQFSILFWLWEIVPDQIPASERLTPAFVAIEEGLQRLWPEQSAHCFYVADKPTNHGS